MFLVFFLVVKILFQTPDIDLDKELKYRKVLKSRNKYTSLLPKYRGAAPIQWAVIDGEEKTGVTIQQMEAGIDTGDILYTKEYVLDAKETGASLFDKLMFLGAEAIVEVLPLIEAGSITPVPQNHEEATHAAKLTKQLGEMDFTKSAVVLERLIRGLNSWPSAYTTFRGKQLKIWEAEVVPEVPGEPGAVVAVDKQSFTVATGEGSIKILELQIEGKM